MLTLLFFAAALEARGACLPPADIARQLRATPDAATYATLGSWYADHHQPTCAVETFRKVTALEPDVARYQYLLGLSLYADGEAAGAVPPLRRSLQLDPASPQTHGLLGAVLDAANDRPSAELEWRLSLARDPNAALALESLSRDLLADRNYSGVIALLQPLAGSGALTDTLAVDLAAAYSDAGLLEDAAVLLRKKLQQEPASLQLAEALSGALILESRFQEAIAALGPVARENPRDIHAQVLLLETLVLAHDPQAEALGEKLLLSAPGNWELLYFMGVLRQGSDDYTGARDFFARSLAAKPENADSHYRMGMALNALKDAAAARQELERAIALGLDTADVHVALAKALRALGDSKGAQEQLALYQQRLKAQADRVQAASKAQQADQAAAAGRAQETVEDYREAFALDPNEPVLAFKLAMALDQTGDHAGERTALLQAIALDPRMSAAQNQIGYLDAGDGDAPAAIEHFRLAVAADPAFSKAWMNLAATLCLESKWTDARQALHRVVELEGETPSSRALLQQIATMEAQAQH